MSKLLGARLAVVANVLHQKCIKMFTLSVLV